MEAACALLIPTEISCARTRQSSGKRGRCASAMKAIHSLEAGILPRQRPPMLGTCHSNLMELEINLSDRKAIRSTYRDCQKWRAKGGVLRNATPPDFKPFDPTRLLPKREWHTLLELGCGLEKWMKGMVEAAAPDATIYACDISRDVLRFFSKEYIAAFPAQRPRHHCIIGDGEDLRFAD